MADIRAMARLWTKTSIEQLGGVATNGASESAKVAACIALLDRGWGKPKDSITGPDGEGPLEMVVRHIYEGKAKGEK